MISFAGNAQEAGAGGRSGAAGNPVHGSLMGCFSLCIWMASFTFLLVHCGSLVSTLVLSSETECPVALQWSTTSIQGSSSLQAAYSIALVAIAPLY